MQSPIKPFDKIIPRIHANIREGIIFALREIFEQNKYSDHVLERMMKANPKWGARDRRLLAETVFDITRYWRLLLDSCNAWNNGGEAPFGTVTDFFFYIKGIRKADSENHFSAHEQRFNQLLEIPVVRESVPDWLNEFAIEQLGEALWEKELPACNIPADVYLRVNTLLTTKEKLQKLLGSEETETEAMPNLPDALKLISRKNVFQTQAFKSGLFEIQDAASQMVAPFLEVAPGMRIIDACAGGGGKTLHLAALMQNKGRIVALDTIERKLTELSRRARRNGVSTVETRVIDSGKVTKRLADSADRLLLDAPCSGSGVIKRNPDTKWKLTQNTISRLLIVQRDILKNYSSMIKPGGLLVYATCSIFPAENERQVERFLAEDDRFLLREEKKILPSETGYDGFYMAKIERIK